MNALVNAPICPLMLYPSAQCERADEALYGMAVEVLEDTRSGWYRVKTHYGYTGYAQAEDLLFGEANAARWAGLPKQVVLKGFCDVQAAPSVQSWALVTLTRGALVSPGESPTRTAGRR